MKRKAAKPLTKHTLNLFEGQVETLQRLHPRLGSAAVIRILIDNHIETTEAAAASAVPAPEPQMDIKEIL